jgi:hypothetical protein
MALGELIEDESGKITGHRVLGIEGPKIERSFTMTGKYKEIEATDIGTFWTVMREAAEAEPVMYAEAQGVMTSKDGDGMATYVAQGIGRFTSPGKIRFHGSVFLQTTSTSGSLIFISKIF